jgi:hypothetical protein
MIGQSFAPLAGGSKPKQPGGGGANSGAQQAIKVLNLRIPRVVGQGAPAPQPLLMSPGAGGVPMPGGQRPGLTPGGAPGGAPGSPGDAPPFGLEEIIKILFGNNPPPGGDTGKPPDPKINYQPLPGGTAGPGPRGPVENPRRDGKNPFGDSGGAPRRNEY